MTEGWRKALDKKQVVGVVFIDFKKALIQYHMLYCYKNYRA